MLQEVQGQGVYIQMADGLQPTFAPTYYHLAEYEQDYDQEGEPLEYEEFEDAIEDEATEPEFYEAVEAAPVSVDNRVDGRESRDTGDDAGRQPRDRTSSDADSSKNVESETVATHVTGVMGRTGSSEVDTEVNVEGDVIGDGEQTGVDISEENSASEEELYDSETDSVHAAEVGVASEEVGHESEHACEDHTTSSEVVEAENSPQETRDESGNTKPESDTDPAPVAHAVSSDQDVEAEVSSGKESGNTDQNEGETSYLDAEVKVSSNIAEDIEGERLGETRNEGETSYLDAEVKVSSNIAEDIEDERLGETRNEGETSYLDAEVKVSSNIAEDIEGEQLGDTRNEPASLTEVSIKGEIKTNEGDEQEVLQVKEEATSPVDAGEDGAVEEEMKEADSGSTDVDKEPA